MWRRSLALRGSALKRTTQLRTAPTATRPRWLSTLSEEEQELMNEPREGMDYDVLLVRITLPSDEEGAW